MRVPSDRKWVGLVLLPQNMIHYAAIQHPALEEAEIIGGWPLVAAFEDLEAFVLAKLKFS